jgi:hypothetical protein
MWYAGERTGSLYRQDKMRICRLERRGGGEREGEGEGVEREGGCFRICRHQSRNMRQNSANIKIQIKNLQAL